MSLKYGFAAAFVVLTLMVIGGVLGLWPVPGMQWLAALAGTALLAAAGAWFADLLDGRLQRMEKAVQRLAAGGELLQPERGARDDMDGLSRHYQQLVQVVNRRLEEMKASAAQGRAIAEHGPDAMWVFHVEAFKLIDVNENFVKLSGYERDQLIGMTPMDVSPPQQARGMATPDYARWLISRVLQGEKVSEPWVIRNIAGEDIPCELRAIHLPSQGRTLICGSLFDLRERLLVNAELSQRRELESLVTQMSARLVGTTPEQLDEHLYQALQQLGRFAQVDRAYVFQFNEGQSRVSCSYEWCAPGIESHIHRLQSIEVAGFSWVIPRLLRGEVVHVPDVAQTPDQASAEREEWRAEGIQSLLLVPMRFGERVLGYAGFDAVRLRKAWPPEIITLLGLFGDMLINVLQRNASEARLRESRLTLEKANEELTRSNAELKQFAYIASHDLQEPLRSISGFSSLLAKRYKGKLDADADEYIQYMTEAVVRMQRMITDLLDYSRIDARAKPFSRCEMNEVVATALANLRTTLEDLHAEVSISETLPWVQGDAPQLAQVLQNLIGNAIKFHADTPPRVAISAQRLAGEWCFTVRDNGIGIAAQDCEKIFQIFTRLNSREKYPGTGIGLAACKRIIERHRGRIWAEPNPEAAGSSLHFTLPAMETLEGRLQAV